MMTLAQLEDRVATLETVVARLQTRMDSESKPDSSSSGGRREEADEDLIPGTEYDLVVTVPPKESFRLQGRIVSIETPPAELGLSDADWALFGSENEDE